MNVISKSPLENIIGLHVFRYRPKSIRPDVQGVQNNIHVTNKLQFKLHMYMYSSLSSHATVL